MSIVDNQISKPERFTPNFEQFKAIAERMIEIAKGHGGKFIVSGFGNHPETDEKLTPVIRHIRNSGEASFINKRFKNAIEEIGDVPGMNTYAQLSLVKEDVPQGRRGTEEEVIGVLGVMFDFDVDEHDPANRHDRLPVLPHAETETSPGSFQSILFFDRPYHPIEVKPLIEAIIRKTKCEATQSAEHSFRAAGTWNWPNKSKQEKRGRSAMPVLARTVKELDPDGFLLGIDVITLDDLKAAVLAKWPDGFRATKDNQSTDDFDWNKAANDNFQPMREETIIRHLSKGVGERSEAAFGFIKLCKKQGYTPEQTFELMEKYEHLPTVRRYEERGFEKSLRDDIWRAFTKPDRQQPSAAEAFRDANKKVSSDTEAEPNVKLDWREQYNEDYAVVRYGSKTRVVMTTADPPVFMSVDDFHNMCAHDWVTETTEEEKTNRKKKSKSWFQWKGRRQYINPGVVFKPGAKETRGAFNLWRGFGVKAVEGDWPLMQQHIHEVICSGDESHAKWVIGWLANGVQHPDRPAGIAIALRGGQGTGKGVFARTYGELFGRHHFIHAHRAEQITGKFNSGLGNACCVFMDEAIWSGDKKAEGALKGIITEPELYVEAKGLDPIMVPNRLRIIIASNEKWFAPVGIGDRRFAVFDVANGRRDDKAYWKALYAEIANGGKEAMLYDLQRMDLSQFDIRTIPDTAARTEQKQRSLRGPLRWLDQVLSDGKIGYQRWTNAGLEIDKDVAYQRFTEFSKDQGEHHPEVKDLWAKNLYETFGPCLTTLRPRNDDGTRPRIFRFATLDKCRAAFADALDTKQIEWDDLENG